MNRDIAIVGVGLSRMGELWEQPLRDLFVSAALKAMDDAGVDAVDALYVGSMSSGLFTGQEHLAALLADYLGATPIPALRVEAGETSGALAIQAAILDVASGNSEVVLAGGVEKMNDVPGEAVARILMTSADAEYEGYQGFTHPALFALMARAHMERYGTTREQIAQVAVKNHAHGARNRGAAQLGFPITVEAVLGSPLVAEPLRMLDCAPVTDGAAAVIVCSMEAAKRFTNHPVIRVKGFGQATDAIALHDRKELTGLEAVAVAAHKAYAMAGITPAQVDVAEVHDATTIAEIMALEALGLVENGRGGPATEAGETAHGGRIPVNTSGGAKSFGNPLGAMGVAQAVEIVTQLRGAAGDRQVENARVGLVQTLGGCGASASVQLLEVV